MSPPSTQPPLFSSLASIFRDVGLYHRQREMVLDLKESLGDIWQAEDAACAFDEGKIRSLSWPVEDGEESIDGDEDEEGDENTDDESKTSGSGQSQNDSDNDNGSDSDSDSESNTDGLEVVFRNESPAPLVLCWVSESGKLHHFYRLEPSSLTQTVTQDARASFRRLKTDHLEHTHPGHAFCLGYAGSDTEAEQVRSSRSFFRRDWGDKRSGSGRGCNGEGQIGADEDTSASSSIAVGGYRPFAPSSSSSSSSSLSSVLSRRIQLVTISHVATNEGQPGARCLRRRLRGSLSCLKARAWCLDPWRRSAMHGKRRDSDSEDDGDIETGTETHRRSLDPRGWRVEARWVRTESKPLDTTAKVYEEVALGGWPCCLEPNWSGGDTVSARKLERDIRAAAALLPPQARAHLRKHCRIWVNRSLEWGPSDCPVKGRGCCYHPGRAWLTRNGLSAKKHMCVEVNDAPNYRKDCDLWGIGGVMLHELSHAYHHGMVPDGYKNKEIQECYELAMKEGLYDRVKYHSNCSSSSSSSSNGNKPDGAPKRTISTARAYACTNAMEYFAELSAAFLGGLDDTNEYNKWYPFNRKQLQKHDPRAYSLLSRLWKVDVGLTHSH